MIGAPVKGIGIVGGGMAKGASFLRYGFSSKKDISRKSNSLGLASTPDNKPMANDERLQTPRISEPVADGSPGLPPQTPPYSRLKSGVSIVSAAGRTPSKSETGAAIFTILAASGFPTGTKVQVHVS